MGNCSISANAKKGAEAETLATNEELTDKEKEALFPKKMNEGQHTDKAQTKKEGPTELDEDNFIKLLLATLKYQDPTQPMDTAQLLKQTPTMTNMEQVIRMTEASKRAYEAQQRVQDTSMVGRTAVYDLIDDKGNAKTTAGKVDAVEFLTEGKVLAHIDDKKVETEDILGITGPTEGGTDLVEAIAKALQEQDQNEKTGKAGKTGKTGEVGKIRETGRTGEAGRTGKPEEFRGTGGISKPGEANKSTAVETPGNSTGAAGTPGAVGSAGGSGVRETPTATAGTTLGSTLAATATASAAAGTSNRKPDATGIGVSNTRT